jgi:hypothetical protein
MQKHSHALLATAVLAAGPVAAAAAEAPLQTLQSQQDIWITNMIQRGHGQYAPGDDKSLRLDSPSTSPCIDKVMTGKAGVSDPLLPLPYSGQRVAVREPVICTDSDPRFAPTSDFVFPIYRQQIWDIGTGNRVRDETDVFFSRRLSDTRPVA